MRRRAAGLAFLFLLPFVAACDIHIGTQVAWSPSGQRVGFLSGGRPWIYHMITGKLQKPQTLLPSASQLAWSADEDVLAVSTGAVVELLTNEEGVYKSSTTFVVPGGNVSENTVLIWNPRQQRLLLLQDGAVPTGTQTSEIVVSSGAIDTAPGVGLYGPGGDWILWSNSVKVGHQDERSVNVRESLEHALLPLSDEDQATLGDSSIDPVWLWGNPLCLVQKHGQANILCFDKNGQLRQRGTTPTDEGSTIFIDRKESLFAVMSDTPTIIDARGKVRAVGKRFKKAVDDEFPGDSGGDRSNVAWSPDGNWLAVTFNGRLCLWNWRNDVVRILPRLE